MLILVGENVFEKHACFIEVVAVGVVNASISSAYPIHGCLTISAMPDNVWDSADTDGSASRCTTSEADRRDADDYDDACRIFPIVNPVSLRLWLAHRVSRLTP